MKKLFAAVIILLWLCSFAYSQELEQNNITLENVTSDAPELLPSAWNMRDDLGFNTKVKDGGDFKTAKTEVLELIHAYNSGAADWELLPQDNYTNEINLKAPRFLNSDKVAGYIEGYISKCYMNSSTNKYLNPDERLTIKTLVYSGKPVIFDYYMVPFFYNSEKGNLYAPEYYKSETNYQHVIIGWDDNYSKDNFTYTPEGDGAFLVKSTNGSNSFNNGYYWLSYYSYVEWKGNAYRVSTFDFADAGIRKYDSILSYITDWSASYYTHTGHRYGKVIYNMDKAGKIYGVRFPGRGAEADREYRIYVNDELKYKNKYTTTSSSQSILDEENPVSFNAGDTVTLWVDFNGTAINTKRYWDKPNSYFSNNPDGDWEYQCDNVGTKYEPVYRYYSIAAALLYAEKTDVVRVTGVKLTENSKTVQKGDKFTLTPEVLPKNADNKKVYWSSSDPTTVSVTSAGQCEALKTGNADITVTTADGGFSDVCSVSVYIPVTGISLNSYEEKLNIEESFVLKATVSPQDATDPVVTWRSDDKTIATVINGKVTAVSDGDTYIIATSRSNKDIKAVCHIIVGGSAPVLVEEINLSPAKISIEKGKTATISLSVLPKDATDKTVTWKSDDETVATVSNGKVTALKKGTTFITATANDKSGVVSNNVTVTVTDTPIIPTSIEITPATLTLKEGETYNLSAKVLPEGADQSVTWTANYPDRATVDTNGKVTALKKGTVSIKAVSKAKTTVYARCTVTIIPSVSLPTSIEITPASLTMNAGDTYDLSAKVLPEGADQSVTWTSNYPDKATVDANGRVTALKKGSVSIKAVSKAKSTVYARCTITILQPITDIKVKPSAITLDKGETATLKATISPLDASNKNLTWSSDKKAVATVDSAGKIKGIAPGTCKITAMAQDGTKIYGQCSVKVTDPYIVVTKVAVSPTSCTLIIGDTKTIVATVSPANATDKAITWSSDKKAVATVDNSGKVTAVSKGTARITAMTEDGVYGICKITVKAIAVTGIKLNPAALTLEKGKGAVLTAVIGPSNATNKEVTWSSDQKAVATVDSDGYVEGKAVGTATISAKTKDGGFVAICKVTVTDSVIHVTKVRVSPSSLSLDKGDTYDMNLVVSPSNATNKEVTWSSDKKAVATVDSNGVITAIGVGTCKITAVSKDNGKYGVCEVVVTE